MGWLRDLFAAVALCLGLTPPVHQDPWIVWSGEMWLASSEFVPGYPGEVVTASPTRWWLRYQRPVVLVVGTVRLDSPGAWGIGVGGATWTVRMEDEVKQLGVFVFRVPMGSTAAPLYMQAACLLPGNSNRTPWVMLSNVRKLEM